MKGTLMSLSDKLLLRKRTIIETVTETKAAKVEDGRLADVAPTILKIMGLEAPAEMNGNVLIK